MLNLRIIIVLVVLSLAGCGGSSWIRESVEQNVPQPPSDQAQVVFLLPSGGLAGLLVNNVFEVRDGKKRHIGMISSKGKLATNVQPGKTQFLSLAGPMGHVLDANLEAGKRYYVILRYIHGAGFQLRPLRPKNVQISNTDAEFREDHPEFRSWVKESRILVQTDEGKAAFKKYYTDEMVNEWYAKAIQNWEVKSPEQKAQLTLNPTDYISGI